MLASSRRRFAALLLLAVLPAVVEASVLLAVGLAAAESLAPQATAVWPYDSYHDLRWLLVYHNSWATFALGLLALVLFRGVLTAGLTALAWPENVPRPSRRWLIRRNIEVAALGALIVSPWAALYVAFSAVALSWYLFASLIPMLLIAPFLQRAGVAPGWWRGLPSARLLGWSLANFVSLTLAAALIVSVPDWLKVPLAALAGVVNGLLWRQTVTAAARPQRIRLARVPVTPIAIVVTMATALVVPPLVGLATANAGRAWQPPIVTEPLPARVPYAVIVIAGYESSWDGQEPADPRVERFSYEGLNAEGRPLPYEPRATHQSLDRSAVLLAAQVDALHRRTGRPVALVGESEGSLILRNYLDKWPIDKVHTVVLLSPLIWPGRIYYPQPGYEGWGTATGWMLRGIAEILNLTRTLDTGPDEPFIRSILVEAPFYRNRILCPVAGVRALAILPTVSATEAPSGEFARIPVVEVPAFHGNLITRREVHEKIVDFLAGESVRHERWEYEVLHRLGTAWQAPPLPLRLNPIWTATEEGDPALTGRICEAR